MVIYFGRWPEWFDLYLLSCRFNPDIDWLFYTDCPIPKHAPENVRFVQRSFTEYKQWVRDRLGVHFDPPSPYKLCDLKPAYGYLHEEDLEGYDFFAFGDIDIIYGQIRQFITDEMLEKYDVIGTHSRRLSGHFSLFRNTLQNREAFRKIPNWQTLLSHPEHLGVDESAFSKLFVRHKNHPLWLRKVWSLSSRLQRRVLFQEQYSTILSPIPWVDGSASHPDLWFWNKGELTNARDTRSFMYLHFMNWKSSRWLPKALRSQGAAWESLTSLVSIDLPTADRDGFAISPRGFHAR